MIFVPRLKVVEPESEVVARSGLCGEWRLAAVNRHTGRERVLADWFPNLILDSGLNRIGTNSNWMASCYVGSGASTPVETQTTLDALVASTSNRITDQISASSGAPWFTAQTITYRFDVGTLTEQLSEIAVGWASNGLFSRARILDTFGAPTTINVLADEYLDAVYRLRCYSPPDDVVTSVTIAGVTTEVIARAANANVQAQWMNDAYQGQVGGGDPRNNPAENHYVYSGTIGPVTSIPIGTAATGAAAINAAYISGSYQRDYSTKWDLAFGNVGGVRSYLTRMGGVQGGFGRMQYQFTPAIEKNADRVLVLNARHIWGRYTP